MPAVHYARQLLIALLPEEGATFLDESGAGSWERLLDGVPEPILRAPSGGPLLFKLRDLWAAKHEWRGAVAATRAIWRLKIAAHGPDHPEVLLELGALGTLADRTGRTQDARELLETAHAGLLPFAETEGLKLAIVSANLANHLLRADDKGRAFGLLQRAWELRRRVAPGTQGLVAAQLAELHIRNGREDSAVQLLEDAWSVLRERPGIAHPRTRIVGRHLATGYARGGHAGEAVLVLRELLDSAGGLGDEELATCSFELGVALRGTSSRDEAFRCIDEAVRLTRQLGDPHPALADRLAYLSRTVIHERQRHDEGEGLLREALEADVRLYGEGSPEVAGRYAQLGNLCGQLGRMDEAMGYLDPAASLLRSTRGDDHPQTALAVEYYLELLLIAIRGAVDARDRQLARVYLERAMTLGPPVLGYKHKLVGKLRDVRV